MSVLLPKINCFYSAGRNHDGFSYELCTRSGSLFDKKGLMNEGHKPAVKCADSICQNSLSVLHLIPFKIPIMILRRGV